MNSFAKYRLLGGFSSTISGKLLLLMLLESVDEKGNALLMAGGWVAVAIILIVGLVGMFIASPFGIFFSGEESPDSGRTMQTVVAELTEEFFKRVDEIAAEIEHDMLRVGGMTIRWNEVLRSRKRGLARPPYGSWRGFPR